MSFLDLDERLIPLAQAVDVVCSPVVDPKTFPEDVDLTLIEGAISNEEDLHKAQIARERSKMVISFGDCAITGNVPAMRNAFEIDQLFERAYEENADFPRPPTVAPSAPSSMCRRCCSSRARCTNTSRSIFTCKAARLPRTPFTSFSAN
jgi:NAD-reducing hydrogenase small subunit